MPMRPKKNPVTKLVAAGIKQGFKTATLLPRLGVRSAIDEKLITKKLGKDKANARGLKAANKPLSKENAKRSLEIKRMAGYIAYDRRPTPPSVKAALGGKKPDGMRGAMAAAKKIAMQEARSKGPAKKISPAQKASNKKRGK